MKYDSTIKKNERLPFVTWVNLESIALSEINQTKIKYHITSLMYEI